MQMFCGFVEPQYFLPQSLSSLEVIKKKIDHEYMNFARIDCLAKEIFNMMNEITGVTIDIQDITGGKGTKCRNTSSLAKTNCFLTQPPKNGEEPSVSTPKPTDPHSLNSETRKLKFHLFWIEV